MSMPMPMSPGAQQDQAAMSAGGGGGAQAIFEKTFSDMAYESLQQKSDKLVPDVVTFRVLTADMERGHAVGAFLISKESHIAYVPVILSDNKIQPIDILFSKNLGKFLPLTDKWLAEVFKVQDNSMGQAAELPLNVNSEVSLRHLFTPNTSGRIGYASFVDDMDRFNNAKAAHILAELMLDPEEKTAKFFEKNIRSMLRKTTLDNSINVMRGIVGSSNKTAEWYLNRFDGPKGLASYFCIGAADTKKRVLYNKFERPKLAAALQAAKTKPHVITKNAPMSKFKEEFGPKAKEKYQEALKVGYVVAGDYDSTAPTNKSIVRLSESYKNELKRNYDEPVSKRLKLRTAEPVQASLKLEWPMDKGFYRVYLTNGKTHDVFVISERDNFAPIRGLQTEGARHIIIYADGSYASMYDCVGTPLARNLAENTNIYKYLTKSLSVNGVKRGYGLFVRFGSPDKFDFVGPYQISTVSVGSSEIRAKTADGLEIILQKDRSRGGKIQLKDSKLVRLSNEYRFIPLTRERTVTYLKQPSDVYRALEDGIIKVSEKRFDIKFDSAGDVFYVNNRPKNRADAVEELLTNYGIAPGDAEEVLDESKEAQVKLSYATLNSYGRFKVSRFFKSANMGPGMGPMGPVPGGGDPSMGYAPTPPEEEISPEELNALAADSAALQQLVMGDPQLAQLIAQKVQELASVDPEAAQMLSESPTIQQLMGGGQPPMDPSMMGGQPPMDPSMMGGQPPMDPSMMGGQPPMDPSMMGGQPPMDPSMMPTGMTSSDTPDATALNPQFQGDPTLLQDPELLQMAHLDVILRSPTLRDVIAEYEDVIIKALDHLGRILFAIYVKSPELKEELGNMQYRAIENGVKNLFKNMGDTILDLHQNTAILSRTLSTGMQNQDVSAQTSRT